MAEIYVSSAAQLLSALSTAKGGDIIKLASGNYGSISLSNLNFASDVTITSADGNQGATFSTLSISTSSNLRIDGVHVSSPSNSGTAVVQIADCTNIDFVNSEVNGKVDQVYPIAGPTFGIYVTGDSSNIVVQNNYVHDVLNGMAFFGTENLKLIGNNVDYVGSDAFKFASVDTALIENNIGPRYIYSTADAHEDFMQFQGGASSNIVIRGNIFLPQNDVSAQGIFVAGNGGHSNITIEQNIIYTGMTNGIYVSDTSSGVVVRYNTVLNALGDDGASRIIASGATVEYNIYSTKSGGTSGTNIELQHTDPNGAYYYGSFFQGDFSGTGPITLADLKPVANTQAEDYGAWSTLSKYLGSLDSGTVTSPTTDSGTGTDTGGTTDAGAGTGGTGTTTDTSDPDLVYARLGNTEFNGSKSSLINVAHNSNLAISEGSIAFTFDADTVSGKRAILSKDASGYDGGGNHFAVWIEKGVLCVRFEDTDSQANFKVAGIKANTDYEVLATFDADKVGLYVNDQLIGTKTFTMDWADNTQKLQLGGFSWTDKNVFDGTLTDVRIFDEAMTPQDLDTTLWDMRIQDDAMSPTNYDFFA